MSLKRYAFGLAAIGLSSAALAQPPVAMAIPGGPGAFPPTSAPLPAPGALGIAPRPAMPTQNTLWSYIGVSADQREYRQRAQAETRFGQLRGRVQEPMSKLTGGLIKPFPPQTPSLAELQAPGAVGAASQVKLDRANAEKRMAAVEYLGSVDCHYWPEAEEALIGALRGDRNECVRLQAANVLLNGCCCTKKIIKALSEVVAGTDCDGFPAEKSSRVRAAAQAALEKCLMCFVEYESKCPDKNCDKKPDPLPRLDPAPLPKTLEKGEDLKKGKEGSMAESYYNRVARMPSSEIIADARKALLIAIPMEDAGPTINQLDLIAAGEPGPDAASMRSPRPTSLMNVLTAKPATPGVTPIATPGVTPIASRPMGSTNMAVHHTTAWTPPPMATIQPGYSKVPAAIAASPPAAPPLKTMPINPIAPPPAAPPTKTMPVSHVAPPPAAPSYKTMPVSHAPPLVAPPTKPMPVNHVAPQSNRGEKVTKMMKGLVPVSELAAAIDALTADDLRASPVLVSELIAAGAQSSNVPVRLATVKALVRCQVATPQATTVLKNAAQTDPEASIRAAAAGFGR